MDSSPLITENSEGMCCISIDFHRVAVDNEEQEATDDRTTAREFYPNSTVENMDTTEEMTSKHTGDFANDLTQAADKVHDSPASNYIVNSTSDYPISLELHDTNRETTEISIQHADTEEPEDEPQESSEKAYRLPNSRVRMIMKTVPSVNIVNSDALRLVSHAAEAFIRNFSLDVHHVTAQDGKKTVSRSHVNEVVQCIPRYEFLDGMLD